MDGKVSSVKTKEGEMREGCCCDVVDDGYTLLFDLESGGSCVDGLGVKGREGKNTKSDSDIHQYSRGFIEGDLISGSVDRWIGGLYFERMCNFSERGGEG